METPVYVHLKPGHAPPPLGDAPPFRAIVIVDDDVTPEWQAEVSNWLVRAGCRYMLAWGRNCGSWDDSVDWANLEIFDFQEVPEDSSVMTTWHDNEQLEEALWFSQFCAMHPSLELERTYIMHIAPIATEAAMLQAIADAQLLKDE